MWPRTSEKVNINHISISRLSVLLVKKNRVPGEIHRPVESHWQYLSYKVASSTPFHRRNSNLQLIVTDCLWARCKPVYTVTSDFILFSFFNFFLGGRMGAWHCIVSVFLRKRFWSPLLVSPSLTCTSKVNNVQCQNKMQMKILMKYFIFLIQMMTIKHAK